MYKTKQNKTKQKTKQNKTKQIKFVYKVTRVWNKGGGKWGGGGGVERWKGAFPSLITSIQ